MNPVLSYFPSTSTENDAGFSHLPTEYVKIQVPFVISNKCVLKKLLLLLLILFSENIAVCDWYTCNEYVRNLTRIQICCLMHRRKHPLSMLSHEVVSTPNMLNCGMLNRKLWNIEWFPNSFGIPCWNPCSVSWKIPFQMLWNKIIHARECSDLGTLWGFSSFKFASNTTHFETI